MKKGVPLNTTLVDYCDFVLQLASLCRSERYGGKWRKDLHFWYLYRQSFYGFIQYLDRNVCVLASTAANEKFQEIRLNTELATLDWGDQLTFDKSRQGGIFHFEHIYSGDMFRKAVEDLHAEPNCSDLVAKLVQKNYRAAWILKTEDRKLKRKGRGTDLDSALMWYSECGIKLVAQVQPAALVNFNPE